MGEGGFADRVDIEAQIEASFVINNVAAVENVGRLYHVLEYIMEIKITI